MTRLSDHALLRYLERAQGIDVEGIRAAIEAQLVRSADAAARMGGGAYTVRFNGVAFIVRGSTVTTVMPKIGDGARFHALAARER